MSRSWVQVCSTFSPLPHRTDPSKSARAISRVIDVDGIHSPCYILATIQRRSTKCLVNVSVEKKAGESVTEKEKEWNEKKEEK